MSNTATRAEKVVIMSGIIQDARQSILWRNICRKYHLHMWRLLTREVTVLICSAALEDRQISLHKVLDYCDTHRLAITVDTSVQFKSYPSMQAIYIWIRLPNSTRNWWRMWSDSQQWTLQSCKPSFGRLFWSPKSHRSDTSINFQTNAWRWTLRSTR